MHEDIINAFQKTNNQDFLGPNNRHIDAVVFLQHSDTVKTIYHFLIAHKNKQLITEDEFNQKIVEYIKNIDGIAIVLTLLKNEDLDENYKERTLESLDIIIMIVQAYLRMREDSDEVKENNRLKYGRYEIYENKISIKDCLDNIKTLQEAFQILRNTDSLDSAQTIFIASHIDIFTEALNVIKLSSLTQTDKEKYSTLICQSYNSASLEFIKILKNHELLTAENLALLFQHSSQFPHHWRFGIYFDCQNKHKKNGFYLNQTLYESLMKNLDNNYDLIGGLETLYTDHVIDNDSDDDIDIPCSNNAGHNVVTPTPELIQDIEWFCKFPTNFREVAHILLNARREKIVMNEEHINALLKNSHAIKTVSEAVCALNPPPKNSNEAILLDVCENITNDGERNPSKEKKLTQEIFDKICEDPQRAMLIAHEKGIQFYRSEQKDVAIAEKIGVTLGKIENETSSGQKLPSLPIETIKHISFWACHNKLDTTTRDVVTMDAYSMTFPKTL